MGPLKRQLILHIFDSIDKEKKGTLATEKLSKHLLI